MSDLATSLLDLSVDALLSRDSTMAEAVIAGDKELDALEIEIEDQAIGLLAPQQPMARDLRFIIASIKVSNDLERVGDHAVTIAQSAIRLANSSTIITPDPEIGEMARRARQMPRDGLTAFVREDGAPGREVCRADDEVDALHHSIFRILVTHMMEDARTITPSLELFLVSRNLERVADLATNIGEDAVFLAEGKQIKHHLEETATRRSSRFDFDGCVRRGQLCAMNSFDITGRVAVVTGGYGVIGSVLGRGLAAAGARVAVLGRRREQASAEVAWIRAAGGDALPLVADATDIDQLRAAREELLSAWGRVDILINAAGGNVARARSDAISVFEIPPDAFDEVLRLNLHGTVLPTMVFAEQMAKASRGSIVNISSMAAAQALSGVMGYSVAKAGIDNFTRWLAVDLARRHGDGVRVNAIAPGFFITTQNRAVLVSENGGHTERAHTILRQTPMGRFGRPEELIGAVRWLCSDAASFVTGAVIPIDGGFSVFSGV